MHRLRLNEFAKHLNKKEFANPRSFGEYVFLKIIGKRGRRNFTYKIKTQKFVIDALVIFYEWNHNLPGELIYHGKSGLTNIIEDGITDFFGLTPQQAYHLLDMQKGKGQRPKVFGGKKLHARSKAKDFALNMKTLLRKT
jgi:hypothetical protein